MRKEKKKFNSHIMLTQHNHMGEVKLIIRKLLTFAIKEGNTTLFIPLMSHVFQPFD
jgi:hypothetical protein